MFSIRRAAAEDLEQVIELRVAFILDVHPEGRGSEAAIRESTRKYVAEKLPTGEFMVWFAEEDGQVIGTGGLLFFHRPPTFHHTALHAYVLNMYTVPECRGRGIGAALLQHIIDHVKASPASRISLHATEMGRPLYERFGFVPTTDEMVLKLK